MVVMDRNNIKKMAMIFRMLSNPNRLQILCSCQEKSISVSDIVGSLNLSQSLISHHLKQLRDANLVQATRQGKNMLYQLQDKRVQCILEDVFSHAISGSKRGHKK